MSRSPGRIRRRDPARRLRCAPRRGDRPSGPVRGARPGVDTLRRRRRGVRHAVGAGRLRTAQSRVRPQPPGGRGGLRPRVVRGRAGRAGWRAVPAGPARAAARPGRGRVPARRRGVPGRVRAAGRAVLVPADRPRRGSSRCHARGRRAGAGRGTARAGARPRGRLPRGAPVARAATAARPARRVHRRHGHRAVARRRPHPGAAAARRRTRPAGRAVPAAGVDAARAGRRPRAAARRPAHPVVLLLLHDRPGCGAVRYLPPDPRRRPAPPAHGPPGRAVGSY